MVIPGFSSHMLALVRRSGVIQDRHAMLRDVTDSAPWLLGLDGCDEGVKEAIPPTSKLRVRVTPMALEAQLRSTKVTPTREFPASFPSFSFSFSTCKHHRQEKIFMGQSSLKRTVGPVLVAPPCWCFYFLRARIGAAKTVGLVWIRKILVFLLQTGNTPTLAFLRLSLYGLCLPSTCSNFLSDNC